MEQDFRSVALEEAAEAEALLRTAFSDYVRRLGREQTAEAYHWLPQACAERRVFGAYQEGNLNGVAIVTRDEDGWTLDQIAITPALQCSGTGSRLLRHIEAEARTAGVSTLSLHTAEIMTHLLQFYERHGFRETHRTLPAHRKDPHLRVYMSKALT